MALSSVGYYYFMVILHVCLAAWTKIEIDITADIIT